MKISITLEVTPENIGKVTAFLTETASGLSSLCVCEEPDARKEEPKPAKAKAKKEEPEPVVEPATEVVSEVAEQTNVTKTDLRAVALKLSKAGKSEELANIFSEFGAANLSAIKESDYAAVMERLVSVNA